MGWWNPFEAIADVATQAIATVIEGVATALGEPVLGKQIADVFEAVTETIVDVVVDIAVGVSTSTPVQATINVVIDLAEGAKDVYDALTEPVTPTELAMTDAPGLELTANYGSDDMLL
ncbi:hypothetical protein PsAD2_03624 [Pseudovibrio axinellae]|uniref:Uncharacterized protein n=1 Tax=Pseudovibrio axinellae TaxID=989403 RepID=A0A161V874_9HYPH|nr:hypothetical protein [Pseudovibrio axinellae]KZL15368.1 hypothetical protein PsAD2_03624 [Pseudovibrio axinellae]SER53570.1 hypothetical protein SAMN05421798_11221 [Pseudovibrio axinellae]